MAFIGLHTFGENILTYIMKLELLSDYTSYAPYLDMMNKCKI